MRRVLGAIAAVLLTACATASEPGPPPWAPVGGVSQVVIDGRTLHYADLLGLPRERIERGLPPGRPKPGPRWAAWVEYGEELEVEYRDGVAVRLRARVPMSIASNCFEAAGWMGFPQPRMPLIDGPRCLWSGPRVNNQLEKGYGGELNREVRWFMVWLIDPSSPVASGRQLRPRSLVAPAMTHVACRAALQCHAPHPRLSEAPDGDPPWLAIPYKYSSSSIVFVAMTRVMGSAAPSRTSGPFSSRSMATPCRSATTCSCTATPP